MTVTFKVNTLKQSPYAFATDGRVDPTREGVEKAIKESRYSECIMDKDYESVTKSIFAKTRDPAELDRLIHEWHNERVAELVRTKEAWLGKADNWPITINQFNEVIEGNHRFRAVRYLGLDEVAVKVVQEQGRRGFDLHEDIW